MPNPLNYVTKKDLLELGLTPDEIVEAYQPSSGGVYHARGTESVGKTLLGAHKYRHLVDNGIISPFDAVGNLTFKGKYGRGFQTLKGEDLKQYLWDMTHKPYRNKFVFIDEIDSEFPARWFADKDQTEISLRLWHTAKLGNYIWITSHIGNSTDVIIHLATHYYLYPRKPNFETNTLDFSVVNLLDVDIQDDWQATDIIKTMLIYSRQELTEDSEESKIRYSQRKKDKKERSLPLNEFELDIEKERLGAW